MTEAAIISGSLVDVRNVGTHKSVKLTIHVPEELAMKVMEAFGWPTGVSPVAVAIARLEVSRPVSQAEDRPGPALPPPAARPVRAEKEKRPFNELAPAQQAGILCGEQLFRFFLAEKFPQVWTITNRDPASAVREICKVDSRADIKPDNADWSALVLAFRLWKNHPEYVA